MMEYPVEKVISYPLLALFVLAVFYGIYFVKMLAQKRRGIRTLQIRQRKEKSIQTVELLMSIATLGVDYTTCVHSVRFELPPDKRALYRLLHRDAR